MEEPDALATLAAPAVQLPDGSIDLLDCCHRLCALYRLRPGVWELTVHMSPANRP
jgi:hypothetical protein